MRSGSVIFLSWMTLKKRDAELKCILHYSQRAFAADRGGECCEKNIWFELWLQLLGDGIYFGLPLQCLEKQCLEEAAKKTTRRSQWGALMAICNTHHYSMDQTGCLATHRLPSNKR